MTSASASDPVLARRLADISDRYRPDLFRRIADPHSVGWAGFWATLGLALVIQSLGALTLRRTDDFVMRTVALVIAQIVMYAVLLVSVRPLLRLRWMQGRWVVTLLSFAVAGLLRQVVFTVLLARLGLQALQPAVGRLVSFALTVAMAMGFAAVLSSLVREQARRRRTLVAEQDRLRHLRCDVAEQLESSHQQTVSAIRAELIAALEALPLDDRTPSALRETADRLVRPLSHELALRATTPDPQPALIEPPVVSWRQTLREAAGGFTVHPGPTAVVGLVFTMLLGGVYGPGLTLTLAVLNGFGTWISLHAVTKLLPPERVSTSLPLGVLQVLLAELPLQILLVAGITSLTAYPFTLAAGAFVFWPLIAYLISLGDRLITQQELIDAEMAQTTRAVRAEIARTHAMRWAQQRRLALALHGPVQSAITAAAIRLDLCVDADGVQELRSEIMDAFAQMDAGFTRSFPEGFDSIRRMWQGACAIRLNCDVPESLLAASACTEALLQITGEACGDAVRHGRAASIDITVTRPPLGRDCVMVAIMDSGTPRPDTTGRVGLGSALLDDLTIWWERDIADHGCTLRAILPLPRANPIGAAA